MPNRRRGFFRQDTFRRDHPLFRLQIRRTGRRRRRCRLSTTTLGGGSCAIARIQTGLFRSGGILNETRNGDRVRFRPGQFLLIGKAATLLPALLGCPAATRTILAREWTRPVFPTNACTRQGEGDSGAQQPHTDGQTDQPSRSQSPDIFPPGRHSQSESVITDCQNPARSPHR